MEHTAANQLGSFYLKQRTERGFCAAQRVKLPSCRSYEPLVKEHPIPPRSLKARSLPFGVHYFFASSRGRKNEITQSNGGRGQGLYFCFPSSEQEGKRNESPWILTVLRWLFQSRLEDSQGHMTLRPVWKWPPSWSPMARTQRVEQASRARGLRAG